MKIFKVTIQAVLVSLALAGCTKEEATHPNIVIIYADGKSFFKDTDITLHQLLKENGYTAACIGKSQK